LDGSISERCVQSLHFDYEATYQFGDFSRDVISAWGLATETSIGVGSRDRSPRLGLRLNFASGDSNPADDRLGTYSALFPNAAYVSEAAIFAPGNGWDVQPFVEARPARNVTLFVGVDFLWRLSQRDAVYVFPGVPLFQHDASMERFTGYIVNLATEWSPSPYVTIRGVYVRNAAGDSILEAGGQDNDFIMLSIGARF